MTSRIVTPHSDLAQSAYEFATINGKQNFDAITATLAKLNIKIPSDIEDAIVAACCDIEQGAFLSGFTMCDALRSVPMLAGGD